MVFDYVVNVSEGERIMPSASTKTSATPCSMIKVGDIVQSTLAGDTLKVVDIKHGDVITEITFGGPGCNEPSTWEYASDKKLILVERCTLQ